MVNSPFLVPIMPHMRPCTQGHIQARARMIWVELGMPVVTMAVLIRLDDFLITLICAMLAFYVFIPISFGLEYSGFSSESQCFALSNNLMRILAVFSICLLHAPVLIALQQIQHMYRSTSHTLHQSTKHRRHCLRTASGP
jgi:hypothetical protein